MKFSKKGRYGLVALIDLASYSPNGYVALNNIAERNGISLKYLEQVFSSFRRAGIVNSIKGSQGGYSLSRSADQITVASIIEALEGAYHIDAEDISEANPYQGIAHTIQKLVIDQINEQLDTVLQNLTLNDLQRDYVDYCEHGVDMYYI